MYDFVSIVGEHQLAMEHVIHKVFSKYSITSEQIWSTFKTKTGRKRSQVGGTKCLKIVEAMFLGFHNQCQ